MLACFNVGIAICRNPKQKSEIVMEYKKIVYNISPKREQLLIQLIQTLRREKNDTTVSKDSLFR